MASDNDRIVEEAFAEAVELDAAEKAAFLAQFSEEHPDLAPRLQRLLNADSAGGATFFSSISHSVEKLELEGQDPWIGKSVGVYTIRERIGAGGMGAVFLADRTDANFTQQVAIKIMSTQLLSASAMTRFRTERQILASLNHPNIAKLVDGGSTDTGLPFLVMEYIDGDAIDAYCDAQDLSLRKRIRLFQEVCSAVDYAHRNLVVHRDLKPSNILVDENGVPKLLDFGIAKLLDPDDLKMTLAQTGRHDRVMTPDYASPEQIRGEAVSVATDIYALGVLLFRLLSGKSPYGALTTPRDVEDAILNTEPKSPSSVLTSLMKTGDNAPEPPDPEQAARLRSLRRLIKGDLDNIVLKCMQKDPERRYASARELSADLERHLTYQPVHARGDNWRYKTKKFVIRRARPLAAAAAMIVALVGLTAYYTGQLANERNAALDAALRAQRAATQANEVSDFLQSLFASASPVSAQGETPTAVDLLDAGVERIGQLSSQPVVQATLLRIMGESYVDLGVPDLSVKLQEQSVAILENNPAVTPLELAEGFHELAEAKRLHGELREAEAAMRRALAIRKAELGPEATEVAYTMARLGTILFDTKDLDEGIDLLRQAIAIRSSANAEVDEQLIDMRGNLAITLDSLGRYDEAEELMQENVVLSERINGELFPNTIIRLSNLGLVQLRRAEHEEGLATMSEALRRAEITWPEAHPNRAVYQSVVGAAHMELGDFDAARRYLEAGLAAAEAGTGQTHFRYVARLRGLATALIQFGEYQAADEALAKALAIADELTAEPTYQSQKVRLHTGQSLNRQGRHAEAVPWLRESLSVPDMLGHSNDLTAKTELASALSHLGEYEEAAALFSEVIAAHEADEGPQSRILIPPLTAFAQHYRLRGDIDVARETIGRALTIAADTLPAGHWRRGLAHAEFARILDAAGDPEGAKREAREARARLSGKIPATDLRLSGLPSPTLAEDE